MEVGLSSNSVDVTMNLMYYFRKGKKQKHTENLSTTKICENGFGGVGFNVSKQFLVCGKRCKNIRGLLAHHTDFDRCHSFSSGAGLGVSRILNTKTGILRRQGDLSS